MLQLTRIFLWQFICKKPIEAPKNKAGDGIENRKENPGVKAGVTH